MMITLKMIMVTMMMKMMNLDCGQVRRDSRDASPVRPLCFYLIYLRFPYVPPSAYMIWRDAIFLLRNGGV